MSAGQHAVTDLPAGSHTVPDLVLMICCATLLLTPCIVAFIRTGMRKKD